MVGERASLLAQKDKLPISDLLWDWAPETDANPELLKNCLMEAMAGAELDGTD